MGGSDAVVGTYDGTLGSVLSCELYSGKSPFTPGSVGGYGANCTGSAGRLAGGAVSASEPSMFARPQLLRSLW